MRISEVVEIQTHNFPKEAAKKYNIGTIDLLSTEFLCMIAIFFSSSVSFLRLEDVPFNSISLLYCITGDCARALFGLGLDDDDDEGVGIASTAMKEAFLLLLLLLIGLITSSKCDTAVLESLAIRNRVVSKAAAVLLSLLLPLPVASTATAVEDEMERLDKGKERAEDDGAPSG